jgi:hypothetical protein
MAGLGGEGARRPPAIGRDATGGGVSPDKGVPVLSGFFRRRRPRRFAVTPIVDFSQARIFAALMIFGFEHKRSRRSALPER